MNKYHTLLLVLGTVIISSCDLLVDTCGPFEQKQYWAKEITASSGEALMNQGYFEINSNADTISYNQYAIELKPEMVYGIISESRWNLNFNIIQSAYACSPPPDVPADTIQSIKIYSRQDFNEKYPAGTNLASLFQVTEGNYRDFVSLSGYLEHHPPMKEEGITLLLDKKPATTGPFTFTVHYIQDGKELTEYSFATDTVVLKRF